MDDADSSQAAPDAWQPPRSWAAIERLLRRLPDVQRVVCALTATEMVAAALTQHRPQRSVGGQAPDASDGAESGDNGAEAAGARDQENGRIDGVPDRNVAQAAVDAIAEALRTNRLANTPQVVRADDVRSADARRDGGAVRDMVNAHALYAAAYALTAAREVADPARRLRNARQCVWSAAAAHSWNVTGQAPQADDRRPEFLAQWWESCRRRLAFADCDRAELQ